MKWNFLGSLAVALLHVGVANASPVVAQATVTGPVTGGNHGFPGTATPVQLGAYGYVEQEFFLSGVATAYEAVGSWGSDGRWSISPGSSAAYTTRILVRRPHDPKRFNGTVLVEWLNVSGNVDVDPDFAYMREELLRGYAWVGVSAQAAGIHGVVPVLGPGAVGLKAWDPVRYGVLNHPGDAYSYDIFSQAGYALLHPQGENPLGGLRVQQLLAAGESQSAFRLLTYANAVQPVAVVYDGILIHSRNGSGAPLGVGMVGGVPAPARIRTDLDVPVFQLQTETDLYGLSGGPGPFSFPAARQPDTPFIRTWEIAGTAHSDLYYLQYLYAQGVQQYGISGFLDLRPAFAFVNSGPQHYVANAALRWLQSWVSTGTAPPHAQPLETSGGAIVRDVHGNAVGGLRTPHVDVPVATLTGEGARLNGRTIPFDAANLNALYPTHGAYVSAFTIATQRSLKNGFILPEGAREIRVEAAGSTIGR
jgi:hypothetical protein